MVNTGGVYLWTTFILNAERDELIRQLGFAPSPAPTVSAGRLRQSIYTVYATYW